MLTCVLEQGILTLCFMGILSCVRSIWNNVFRPSNDNKLITSAVNQRDEELSTTTNGNEIELITITKSRLANVTEEE